MNSESHNRTLLVIDDDVSILRSLEFGLSPRGWQCKCFTRWAEAVSRLGEIRPDVALIDLHLAGDAPKDGFDVIYELRQRLPELPIVALTGHPDYAQAAQRCIKVGALQFVRKPVGTEELEGRIEQAIWIEDIHLKYLQAQEREIKAAEAIQRVLLCPTPPRLQNVTLDVARKPAKLVTGDYYDFTTREAPERLITTVGDAENKGIQAALNAHLVAGAWRAVTERSGSYLSPGQTLRLINRMICRTNIAAPKMTLLVGELDIHSLSLTYASAGHLPPLLFRGGSCQRLDEGDLLLGVDEACDYQNWSVDLCSRDMLVLYSDGITDLEWPPSLGNGKLGIDGLSKEAEKLLAAGREGEFATRLLRHLSELFGDERFFDDCTIVTMEISPSA